MSVKYIKWMSNESKKFGGLPILQRSFAVALSECDLSFCLILNLEDNINNYEKKDFERLITKNSPDIHLFASLVNIKEVPKLRFFSEIGFSVLDFFRKDGVDYVRFVLFTDRFKEIVYSSQECTEALFIRLCSCYDAKQVLTTNFFSNEDCTVAGIGCTIDISDFHATNKYVSGFFSYGALEKLPEEIDRCAEETNAVRATLDYYEAREAGKAATILGLLPNVTLVLYRNEQTGLRDDKLEGIIGEGLRISGEDLLILNAKTERNLVHKLAHNTHTSESLWTYWGRCYYLLAKAEQRLYKHGVWLHIVTTLPGFSDKKRNKSGCIFSTLICNNIKESLERVRYFNLLMGANISMRLLLRAQSIIRVAQIKSAIGSIMSRNGSHNIGSHVLAALSHNVGTMPDDRVLYQYIQHRMDYIATATTDFPSWTYSTKFVGGLIREFLSQRHLLEYISKSEGLQAFRFQDLNHIGDDRFNQENTIRLHVRRSGYGLPEGVKEVEFIEYSKAEDDARQRLQHDIDVALPGGVIGGHAFFTILENEIRNAAKHGWATRKEAARKEKNLDIYVDFELDADCQNVTVKVHDGMSDVLSVADEEKIDNVDKRNGLRKLKDWIETNRVTLCRSLDKKSLEQLKAYIEDKGENLPMPYGGLVDVLNENVNCGDGNNGDKIKVWEAIKELLTGKTGGDKELGHRLWLPLHHSQQIKLATPFIDDAGSLRRENWGLAEMKISAGYLQMRPTPEIGGLDEDVNGCDGTKKMITPVCVKHIVHRSDRTDETDKERKEETHYHLGYEFKIRCPREVLFVVRGKKPGGDVARAAEQILLRHGVHIRYIDDTGYDAVFALQNNPSRLEWDFRYVILPVFPKDRNPKLPFRVLTGEQAPILCVPHFSKYDNLSKVLANVLNGGMDAETWALDLKKDVYNTWRTYWVTDRRRDIGGEPVLSLIVDPNKGADNGGNNKKGGECLISDRDLWKVVLDNLFRTLVRQHLNQSFGHDLEYRMKSYLVMIAVSDTRDMMADFDVSRPRYSLGCQMVSWFEKSKSQREGAATKKTLVPLIGKFMGDGDTIPKGERDIILRKLADNGYDEEILEFHRSLNDWIEKCKNAKSSFEHDFEAPQVEVNGKSYNYPGFNKFMDSCQIAFEHSAVFLRKYEERIATLPESFQVMTNNGVGDLFTIAASEIGIDAFPDGRSVGNRKAIRYERHFDVGAFVGDTMVYAEPLSGTQTYLNTLGQLVGNPECSRETIYSVTVTLMENALSRVLIIDERTADFLKQHVLSKQTYAHMGVWVLDDKTVEGCASPQKSSDNTEWSPNVEQALLSASDIGGGILTDGVNRDDGDGEEARRWSKFDIVIIHQGLIDKWLPASAHGASGVEDLLERLKERVPYVVITTGRGTPSNTPASARILPFSVIEKTMFRQSPEKMILVDTVMNILPVGERKQ
ncbi:MAG: hypothetical protein IJH50_04895 [Kiritimatiellae bacterium]|nr:hypothetical protein [Kiritimatiellia bacterium]